MLEEPQPALELEIPISNSVPLHVSLLPGEQLFIVGPNGCGKSALLQLFSERSNRVRRINAHRQTWIPTGGITMTPAARQDFESRRTRRDRDSRSRWRDAYGDQSLSAVLFDLVAIENARARKIAGYADENDGDQAVSEAQRSASPFTVLNKLLRIGLLAVTLENSDDTEIKARNSAGIRFPLPEMSDGERSAVIIAATVLTANAHTIFLIDEPERHLHRAIITPFLAALFAQRPDCAFVIATHETALPLTAPESRVLVMRACTSGGAPWEADLLEGNSALPEDLKVAVLGGREKLLFVEGVKTSLDSQMYEALLPGVSVIPRGNCIDVERSVAGLRNAEELHHLRAYGLIDRDTRTEDQVNELQERGLFALDVYSVEALYYCSAAIEAVAQRQAESIGADAAEMAKTAKLRALVELGKQDIPKRMAARRCEGTVRRTFMEQAPTWRSVLSGNACNVTVDLQAAHEEELCRYKKMLEKEDLDGIVARYPIRHTQAPAQIWEALQCRDHRVYESMVVTQVSANASLRRELIDKLGKLSIALEQTTETAEE